MVVSKTASTPALFSTIALNWLVILCKKKTKKVGFGLRKSSYFFFVLLTQKMIFVYDEILAF